MMNKLRFLSFVLLLFSLGCNVGDVRFDDLQIPNYQGIIAVPLGEVTYTLTELIDELGDSSVLIEEDENTFLTLVYFDTISYDENELIDIQDINQIGTIPIPPSTTQIDLTIPPLNFDYPASENEEVTQLDYESGELEIMVETSGQGTIEYRIEIPNTFNIGSNATVNFLNSATSATPGVNTIGDLNGYRTTLTRVGNENRFTVNLTDVVLVLGAGEATVTGDEITVTVNYRNQVFESIYGRFGRDTIQLGSQEIDLPFFSELGRNGQLIFENPQIRLNVSNSIGVPLGLRLGGIYTEKYDSATNTTITTILSGQVVQNLQIVRPPALANIGQAEETILTIENRNSNIRNLLSTAPGLIGFDISAITNPPSTSSLNFIQPTNTSIETIIEMRLPLAMQLRNLQRELEFVLPASLDELDDADSVSLRIVTENLLPFNTRMDFDIIVADTVGYRIPNTLIMATPFLNSDRIANEKQVNIANISLNPEAITAMQNGEMIRMTLTMNTPQALNSNEIYPRFLSRYELTVKLSVAAKLDIGL